MFTQGCFIRKNSEYLRKSLDLIGKRNLCNIHDGILITHSDRHYSLLDCNETIEIMLDDCFIDCGTNEELFLAIAALRDDSDKFQYFTNGVFWIKCSQLELKHELDNNYEEFCVADFHKATVSELIEHFNK